MKRLAVYASLIIAVALLLTTCYPDSKTDCPPTQKIGCYR